MFYYKASWWINQDDRISLGYTVYMAVKSIFYNLRFFSVCLYFRISTSKWFRVHHIVNIILFTTYELGKHFSCGTWEDIDLKYKAKEKQVGICQIRLSCQRTSNTFKMLWAKTTQDYKTSLPGMRAVDRIIIMPSDFISVFVAGVSGWFLSKCPLYFYL